MRTVRTSAAASVRHAVAALCCVLWSASPVVAQGGWGVVTQLSEPGAYAYGAPVVDFDAEGNGFAVWNTNDGIRAARYTRASGAWSRPQLLNTELSAVLNLFVHPAGNAILTWLVISDNDVAVGARAALYDAGTATWSPPTEFSRDGYLLGGVIDSQGNAVVAWSETASGVSIFKTAAFNRRDAAWRVATDIPVPGGIVSARLALDSNDRAIAIGQASDGVTRVTRFIPSIASWAEPVTLGGQGLLAIEADRAGNLTVVWTRPDGAAARIEASRYSANTNTWNAPATLAVSAPGLQQVSAPAIASDAAGNMIVVWEWSDGLQWTIQGATYRATSHSWDPAVGALRVAPNRARLPSNPQVRLDAFGNATVVWSDPSIQSVEAARRTPDGSWSPFTLAAASALSPRIAVDPGGNVTVVWALSNSVIQSRRWVALPPAPVITQVTSSNGTLTVFATAPASPHWFGNTNYEYSLDDGATWTTRSPASAASPLVLDGLVNGTLYHLRLRGMNSAGVGAPSGTHQVVPGLGAPANLNAATLGNTVLLRWSTSGHAAPTGYVVEAGLAPGEVLASIPIQGPVQTFIFTTPRLPFYARLYATLGGARSLASNEVLVTGPPPARAFLSVSVLDHYGVCIEGAIVEVIAGQGIGQRKRQETWCNQWESEGVLFTDLIGGVPMTLRASAPGYAPLEQTVVPMSGPYRAVLIYLTQLQGVPPPSLVGSGRGPSP